jgi:hypothetical protein
LNSQSSCLGLPSAGIIYNINNVSWGFSSVS